MIIQALNRYQKARGGYLTDDDLREVAKELQVPLHKIQELVTFYPHYRTTPPPCVEVHVCRDMTCHLRGSVKTIEQLKTWAHDTHGDAVHVAGVSCLGRCDRAPAALVNEKLYVLKADVHDSSAAAGSRDWFNKLSQVVNEHVEVASSSSSTSNLKTKPASDWDIAKPKIGTWEMDVYAGKEKNYQAVRNYLNSPNPKLVIDNLERAGLLGMGGAGGKTFEKWRDVWQAESRSGEKYVVCNADESEPGTFKDRDLLLAATHLTVEGMILGGLVVGASKGWIYIRHEYPEQALAIGEEIERAKQQQALGDNIFGSGKRFDLDIFISPGNYICGEQTALIEAMEDKRAEPRIRPPQLSTNGYKDEPTLLNNVETFAWVPAVMLREDGAWYAQQGLKTGPYVGKSGPSMRGRRLLSISGDICRPGAYEVPTGITLGELINKQCGGMLPGKELIAVALSGPSNGLLPAKIPVNLLKRDFAKYYPGSGDELDILELPLDISVAREFGIMIGAGIAVYGTGCDVLAEAMCLSAFFRNESCGKCVPCRIGSQKITELGFDVLEGKVRSSELPVLKETVSKLSEIMKVTSICGLGAVAHEPMRSIVKYFPELLDKACQSTQDQ